MPVDIVFREDAKAMAKLKSWEGACGKDIDRRLKTLQFRAKSSVGVSKPNPGNLKPGGALKMSIHTIKSPVTTKELSAKVGSPLPYALFHHEATGQHSGGRGAYKIVPRRPGGMLRFWWARTGKIEYRRSVMHPGSRANPYLTRWLREAVK